MKVKMKFDIQMFAEVGEEASFNPVAYENMIAAYDSDIPVVNQAFVANQEAIQVFKNAAGSPKLSELTRELIKGLNSSIEETVAYFDSVKNWSAGVVSAVASVLGTNLASVGASVDKTVLDTVNENYNNGRIGMTSFADAETYISNMQDVVNKLRNGLSSITSDVNDAKSSLPNSVAAAFSNTITTNNDSVLNGYDQLTQYLTTNVEEFRTQLQNAIDEMTSAASGQ